MEQATSEYPTRQEQAPVILILILATFAASAYLFNALTTR